MHSKMDCISRSPLFAPLSPTIKTKLITVTHHRKFFQKGQLIRQPLDHQEGMLIFGCKLIPETTFKRGYNE